MSLIDRFNDNSEEITITKVKQKSLAQVSSNSSSPFQTPKFDQLKDELFEKIVSVPCWFEYDFKTQHDLIIRFLNSKNIATPEVFAKMLQHSILGFGVFDDYLLKDEIEGLTYIEGEGLWCKIDGQERFEHVFFSSAKINFAIQNIINMSQISDKNGVYQFRIGNFWVELNTTLHSKIKLSVSKITDKFFEREINKNHLTRLLSSL